MTAITTTTKPNESTFLWADGESERSSLFPIRHQDIWDIRKKLEGLRWNAQEVDLTRNKHFWTNVISDDCRHFIKMQLAFFSTIDVDVLKNLDDNFVKEIDCMEARMVYAAQMDQECTHVESYSLQIESVMDGRERTLVLNAFKNMPIISAMRDWAIRWFSSECPIGYRLVASAAVEGVMFCASFSAIQWLRTLNVLPGITFSNDLISRDEGVHTKFSCLLIKKYLAQKPPVGVVHNIFRDLLMVMDMFVDESLPRKLPGMNAHQMKQYVRFQTNFILSEMNYPCLERADNPFGSMDALALNDVCKGNFFEVTAFQYQNIIKPEFMEFRIDASPIIL